MTKRTGSTIYWLFGRGASIECGLKWVVPKEWVGLPRPEKVKSIKKQITLEMKQSSVSGTPYHDMLDILRQGTKPGWRHKFITTNWDYLLQKEIDGLKLKQVPLWLQSSAVSHMNGTVEVIANPSNRSPFLLEDDPPTQRKWSVEANDTYNNMIWGRYFIVVGVSFECDTDRFLLKALGDVSDDLAIGESHWIVLNPSETALHKVQEAIRSWLPNATIALVQLGFKQWTSMRMPELESLGVLTAN